MGCIHELYDLPAIQLVAGSTEPLVFYCWHEMTKDRFDVSGCTANFSIENYVNEEYVNDVKPSILTKPMIVDAPNNALTVTLESFDTINIIPGEYIYQITLKDTLSGMVEIPHQGIIYVANNINKDFLLNGKYPTLFDTSDATATASDILYPKTAYGPEGKITGSIQPVPQAVPQISVDTGGLVTATSTQTSGIIAAGIKTNTYQIPAKSASSITVNGSTVTIPAGYYPTQVEKTVSSAGTDTSDATVSASDILFGKTAYANGRKITGVISSVSGRTITPSKSGTTAIQAGKYASGDIIVSGDSNLTGANIKRGVSIFGVNGTYEGAAGGDANIEIVGMVNTLKDLNSNLTHQKSQKFSQGDYYQSSSYVTFTRNDIYTMFLMSNSPNDARNDAMSTNTGVIISAPIADSKDRLPVYRYVEIFAGNGGMAGQQFGIGMINYTVNNSVITLSFSSGSPWFFTGGYVLYVILKR